MKPWQERAFSIVAKYDARDDLFWHADFSFVGIMCSDFFIWGCADCEGIDSYEDADALEQAYKDVLEIGPQQLTWASELYAARKRKWLPASFIKFKDEKVKALFDAIDGKRHE